MDVVGFIEGPMLWVAFLTLFAGISARTAFQIYAFIVNGMSGKRKNGYLLIALVSSLFPFHKAALEKSFYTITWYVFHIFLFVVPIWFSGHIWLWEESRFEWAWAALSDDWADWMTIAVLMLSAFCLLRRTFWPQARAESSYKNYVLIIMSALPFLTGYFYTHSTLDSVKLFRDNMMTFHIVSAEILLIMIPFLYLRVRIDARKCIGCASCTVCCPVGSLQIEDRESIRMFTYTRGRCITCGSCVVTCPEKAVHLQHEFGLRRLFKLARPELANEVELGVCGQCGNWYAPELALKKITLTAGIENINLCPSCKKAMLAVRFFDLAECTRKTATACGSNSARPAIENMGSDITAMHPD